MVAAISKIKDAEESSAAAIRQAAEKAQGVLKTANATAAANKKAILEAAQAEKAAILQKARQEAEKACVPLDEQARQDIARILHPKEPALTETIDALVRHLVG